jgi:HPt (histidine-containing phosphotransfer) domain-containing protein
MQINTQVNDSKLELKLRQFLSELNLRTDNELFYHENPLMDFHDKGVLRHPDINSYLQIKTTEDLQNPKLVILNAKNEVLDFMNLPLRKDVFTNRIRLWTNPYKEAEFIRRNALLKISDTIGLEQTRKIFDSFISSSQNQFTLINRALSENNTQNLYDSAHYLKTSAGIVGADSIFNFCEVAIEKAKSKEPWTPFLLEKFKELETLFQNCATNFRP